MPMATAVTLNVEGMNCGHCSGMVQKTLERIKGITNISVSLENKQATFDIDTPDLIDLASDLVTKAGYPASR
jgi:Cu+-exporting ATPase